MNYVSKDGPWWDHNWLIRLLWNLHWLKNSQFENKSFRQVRLRSTDSEKIIVFRENSHYTFSLVSSTVWEMAAVVSLSISSCQEKYFFKEKHCHFLSVCFWLFWQGGFIPLIPNVLLITCDRQTTNDADNEMRRVKSENQQSWWEAALRGQMRYAAVCQYNPVPLIGGFTVKENGTLWQCCEKEIITVTQENKRKRERASERLKAKSYSREEQS